MWPAAEVAVNGITVHYYRTGGAKPPLVLAHGFSDNGLCWTPVARALAADYDLILYDARGHGLSEGPESGYSDDHHAEDLAALVKALGLAQPVVIGHSMGARTAAMTAARYPKLLRAVVLEDPPWFADWATRADVEHYLRARAAGDQPPEVPRFKPWLAELRQHTREELIARCEETNPGWPDGECTPWAESKLQFNMAVFSVLAQDMPLSPPWRETVAPIACPFLLLSGDVERGALITPTLAAEVVALNPNARHIHIADVGHNIRRENHAQYMATLTAFLSEIYPA